MVCVLCSRGLCCQGSVFTRHCVIPVLGNSPRAGGGTCRGL